jgi:hypothetical protein
VKSRRPVSIVCVFNAPLVREDCLDRSVEALRTEAPETEYIALDNTGSAFGSAGAALNEGARRARHEYVVFVHQDVALHSLRALEEAAGLLADDPALGLLGACGVDARGDVVGRIRDRVVLIGRSVTEAADVDSLDEVLFIAPRALLLEHPLSEDRDLAWHAYAVEYGLRVRELGRRVVVADLPVTHNSLTVNLARLDEAHAAVARAYPGRLPVRTTCGTINDRTPSSVGRRPFLQSHRWRYRWLRSTRTAHTARRAAGGAPVVLADIRLDVDDVIGAVPSPFHVFNVDPDHRFGRPAGGGELHLHRRGRPVTFHSGDREELLDVLRTRPPGTPVLVTNLLPEDLAAVVEVCDEALPPLVGWHESADCWLLVGCPTEALPVSWRNARATPLGLRKLA